MTARKEGHKVWKELASAFAFAKAVWKGKSKGMWNPLFPCGGPFMPGMEGAESMPWWADAGRDWSAANAEWGHAPDMPAADFSRWPSWDSWSTAMCPGFGAVAPQ